MIKRKYVKLFIVIMLLSALLCGCGSVSVPCGESFVYQSDGTYFLLSEGTGHFKEIDLSLKADGNVEGFFTDSTLIGKVYRNNKNGLEVYPVPVSEHAHKFRTVNDINMEEPTTLSDSRPSVALTKKGLYYEKVGGELWFTDFHTNAMVCQSYRNDDLGVMSIIISAGGMNVFGLYNGELHEYRLSYGGNGASFSDSIIDRDVLGIFGDRQIYDEVHSEFGAVYKRAISINVEEFTNIYYWKKDENFDIFDYYADENNGEISVMPSDLEKMNVQDPVIREPYSRALMREQLQSFNERDQSVRKIIYYDASKQTNEVVAESVFVSTEMCVYENGYAFTAPFIISLKNIGDYQFSFEDWRNNSYPTPFSMIEDYVADMINGDGIGGYILFSGNKIPIQYQCDRPGTLRSSKLYYDFTNHNLYQLVGTDSDYYKELRCFTSDASGTINYKIPKVMNISLMGQFERAKQVRVHAITEEGIIYSIDYTIEDSWTGQCSGILYCNDVVLLDTGNLYTVMTARNKSYVEAENDKIYVIDNGELRTVIDKSASLIHVDRRYDATFDYVLDGYIYRWKNNESRKLSSHPVLGRESIFYLIESY